MKPTYLVSQFEEKIKELEKELEAAKRLLWLSIYINNSEIRIPDRLFLLTENEQELECWYDVTKRETVLRSKISIPKFTPSANEPDKT